VSSGPNDNSKVNFRKALEKKKSEKNHLRTGNIRVSKIRGGQAGVTAPKMFRRKSGSS